MDVCQLLLDFDLFRVFLKLLPVFLPFLAPLAEENGYLRHGTIPTTVSYTHLTLPTKA